MASALGGLFGDTPSAPQVSATPAPAVETKETPPVDANAADYAKKKLEALKARQGRNALRVDQNTGTQTGSGSTGLAIP